MKKLILFVNAGLSIDLFLAGTMIKYFRSLQPANHFLVAFIVMLLWMFSFKTFPHGQFNMPLYQLLIDGLLKLPMWFTAILSISLAIAQTLLLNHVLNKHEVLYKSSYLPGLLYAILLAFNKDVTMLHPVLCFNFIFIFILDKLLQLFKNPEPVASVFDCGLLIGISSLFYLPSIIYYLFFLVGIIVIRTFNAREFIISLIGFLLPFFFYATYLYWYDGLLPFAKTFLSHFGNFKLIYAFKVTPQLFFFSIFTGILLVWSMLQMRGNYFKNAIKTRLSQQLMFILLIFGMLTLFIVKDIELYHFTVLAAPVAAFTGYYFLSATRRAWIAEIILWMLIGIVIWSRF